MVVWWGALSKEGKKLKAWPMEATSQVIRARIKQGPTVVAGGPRDDLLLVTEQYRRTDGVLRVGGMGTQRVNIVVGTKSINTEKWNEAMAKLAMPKAAWDSVRGRMMTVLLEEQDTI